MKRFIYVSMIAALLFGCEGKEGPQGPRGETGADGPIGAQGNQGIPGAIGPKGEKGDQGIQGAIGPKGEKGDPGIGSVARYYDFSLSWNGTRLISEEAYVLPKFDAKTEYVLLFINSEDFLWHPLPYYGAAFTSSGSVTFVDMKYYYTSTGGISVSNWEYRGTGVASFKFRAVVASMAAGATINARTPYRQVKEILHLED